MKTETVTLVVGDGSHMQASVAYPDSKLPAPGIIVFQEAFGVNAHIRKLTEMFAKEGYVAIAPELYHRTAEPGFGTGYDEAAREAIRSHRAAITDELLKEDIRAVHQWFITNSAVDERAIGSVGYCMGGRASFLASTILPLRAAVSYYGGGITSLLRAAKDVSAPLLFFWGGQDAHISKEERTSVLEALEDQNKKYFNVEFSYAGHGFACDERESYNEEAAVHALRLTRSFLRDNLLQKPSEKRLG